MPSRRAIYLHGFASSPRSSKALFFKEKLAAEGFTVEIPDLAGGDFEHLTISRQLAMVKDLLAVSPATLIGSSLGGYLAALCAARHSSQVERVVLLAPAFGFHELWTKKLGQENLRDWRKNGTISVFHYGEGRDVSLAFDLMDDASQYEAFPEFRQPGLIFHGVDDPVVPVSGSRSFAAAHENIQLMEFQSGHELTNVLDDMWLSAREFLLADVVL